MERSNAPFKRSLYEWMEKNPGDSWAEVGAYIVNVQMNQRPSRSKDNKSPYEIYYGKHSVSQSEYYLDPALLKAARTEYSLNAINEVLRIVSEKNVEVQVHLRDLYQLVIDADGIHNDELAILIAWKKKKVDYFHSDVEQQLQNCINNYVDIILSHSDIETNQEPEEDRKPAPLLDKTGSRN